MTLIGAYQCHSEAYQTGRHTKFGHERPEFICHAIKDLWETVDASTGKVRNVGNAWNSWNTVGSARKRWDRNTANVAERQSDHEGRAKGKAGEGSKGLEEVHCELKGVWVERNVMLRVLGY